MLLPFIILIRCYKWNMIATFFKDLDVLTQINTLKEKMSVVINNMEKTPTPCKVENKKQSEQNKKQNTENKPKISSSSIKLVNMVRVRFKWCFYWSKSMKHMTLFWPW